MPSGLHIGRNMEHQDWTTHSMGDMKGKSRRTGGKSRTAVCVKGRVRADRVGDRWIIRLLKGMLVRIRACPGLSGGCWRWCSAFTNLCCASWPSVLQILLNVQFLLPVGIEVGLVYWPSRRSGLCLLISRPVHWRIHQVHLGTFPSLLKTSGKRDGNRGTGRCWLSSRWAPSS